MDDETEEVAGGRGAEPTQARRPAPLTSRERRLVALATVSPIPLVALVLTPVAVVTGASAGEVAAASAVYGGLVALAAGFVAVAWLQARQCPRCRERTVRRRVTDCPSCGYDLGTRPRYACGERHGVYLDEGLCDCGRRLQRLPTARGVGREVAFMLRLGAWLLAFLLGVALVLQLLERNL